MPDLPAWVWGVVAVAVAAAWVWGARDVWRDRRLGGRGRAVWLAAFLVFWVMAPIAWGLVRLRRAHIAARAAGA